MKKYNPIFVDKTDGNHGYPVVKFAVEDGIAIVYFKVGDKIEHDYEENGEVIIR